MRNTVLIGSALDQLRTLPSGHVHCVVTSPPYYSLRDYGTPDVTWGDGWVGQLGREPTPEAYIQHLLEVTQELHRVLRPEGSLWLNIGDSYLNKELAGIPWQLVFSMKAQGWRLRSEIVWHKTAGMPENVSDRPTQAFEPVFLLTKQADAYYDNEAVRTSTGANRRNVWPIGPSSYRGTHSAVFPPELPQLCIKAGTSAEGACEACGAPLKRNVQRVSERDGREGHPTRYGDVGHGSAKGHSMPSIAPPVYQTLGWIRTCKCPAEGPVDPCIVLDPFSGSGTTLQEAQGLGRDYLGIEINPVAGAEIQKRLDTTAEQLVLDQARRSGLDVF